MARARRVGLLARSWLGRVRVRLHDAATQMPGDARFAALLACVAFLAGVILWSRGGAGVAIVRAPTHVARAEVCAAAVAPDACGAVVPHVEALGRTLYCLAGTADDAPLALYDLEDLLPADGATTRETMEMDAPCPDLPQPRVRYTRVQARFRCCPPMNITGAQAQCLQHLHETVRVGWSCHATTATAPAAAAMHASKL